VNQFSKKEKSNFPCQLTLKKSNFGFLHRTITFLEKRGTKVSYSLKIIAKNKINDMKCVKAILIVNKINKYIIY